MVNITLSPVAHLSIDLDNTQTADIELLPVSSISADLDNIENLDIDELNSTANLDVDFNAGIVVDGSRVVVNPPDEPTDSTETIKVDGKTWDIFEKDPTVPGWAKAPTKPSYTAEEVGAVVVDNELAYAEIDRMFNAVFGI